MLARNSTKTKLIERLDHVAFALILASLFVDTVKAPFTGQEAKNSKNDTMIPG